MRWRGYIYRFAFCTCGFVCMTWSRLVKLKQFGRATRDLFPCRMPLVPRAPSLSSSTRHRYGHLSRINTHTRSSVLPSLHYKLCSQSRDPAVEPSLGLAILPSGTVGARLLPPSVLLSLDLSLFDCLFLSSMGAPAFSSTRSLPSNRLTSASPPVMRHSGYGTWACVPSWYRLTFSESRTPAVWFSPTRHLLLYPLFFFSI
ncbi:hypothetical protein V8E53_006118 [Lactarius tabidus]|jgi:hypothetical protein